MADLGAIEEDVPFDYATADELARAVEAAAAVIEGQAGSRASLKNTALTDFRGAFSRLFRSNAAVAAADATELSTRLREVATGARRLKEEARKEQQRREAARRWKAEQEDRNLLEKGHDFLFGSDDPPVGPPAAEPTIPVSPPVNGTRETPAPGSGGGGGGGTSSARPEDLRAFAHGSRGADHALQGKPGRCRSAYGDFEARCRWGRLEASGVFTGFDKYLAANQEDVRWATTVADAFAAAGGEGAVSTLSDSAVAAALRAAGVDATRDDIVIDPPTAYGTPPTTGYANDPVNTATGNFLENETDLSFPGAGATLALTRTYNSFDTTSGGFGPGWSSWTEAGITLDDEAARMRLPDGRVVVFPRLGSGWDRATGASMWLEASTDRTLRVTDNAGRTWVHSPEGELLHTSSGVGTGVSLSRQEGRVVRLEHDRGRALDLEWDPSGERVTGATTSDGRQVEYGYDEIGRLVTVTGPTGTRRYAWNDAGLIETVTDADGVVEAENTYDERGRVSTQRSQFGRLTRFVYLPGNTTVVSDPDGSRSNTWIHDQRGRLVGVVDAHEQRQSTSYDNHGNQVMVTERDGSVTVHEYDERGRRTRTVTPTGADLTYSYDDHDRVTTIVTESGGVVEYAYEGEGRNPSVMTDPEGGQTRFTWESGLLTQVVDPVGVVVRFEYDDHGDLVATTDAEGNSARLERDTTGRVRAAITPSGERTTFTYSPAGTLASRRDPDGAIWRYEHTPGGRLTATVDPLGGRTEVEHGSHGEATRTIDPLGRTVTRHLDDLGNLASVELPDGSRWHFTHDALSRLVETTDPAGASWHYDHDEVGDLTRVTDPTGTEQAMSRARAAGVRTVGDALAETGLQFDRLGRLVSTRLPDGSTTLTRYDRCGRPVEHVDAAGAATSLTRDPAGRVVEIRRPTGGVRHLAYDDCGRIASMVDETGAGTAYHYDADGRVVREVLPNGDVAHRSYDACGRVVEEHRPGHGTTRVTYDLAGRLTACTDPRYGRRSFRYDAAGQLVEVVGGNGGSTRFGHDANGRAVTVTDPLGHTTRRDFDATGRLVNETDPLGRTTRAGYDEAGRQVWQENPDGTRITWEHDESGRLRSLHADGTLLRSLERDIASRRMRITEGPVTHELEWDARGRLVSRTRDGVGLQWEYDDDGMVRALRDAAGHRTTYERDEAGRVVSVDHPLLGRAALELDAAGQVVAVTAGGSTSRWERRDGVVVTHDSDEGRTTVRRDDHGRVVEVRHGQASTTYDYDEAAQLIESRTGGSVTRWHYDAAGRLTSESTDGTTLSYDYDAAGQLTSVGSGEGRISYSYDEAGRRCEERSRGRSRTYSWDPTGWLRGITDHSDSGDRRTEILVDALGELARVDGSEVFWDHTSGVPTLAQVGATGVVTAGPVTGAGEAWFTPGWRTARSGQDPWRPGAGTSVTDDIVVGAAGELVIDGLEWLTARVYDPATRGFLSVDPLDPVVGAGWAGNRYAYAGNDPLQALDPTGLRPVTDAELQAYIDSHQGALAAAGDWVADNWEYLAGGAMVIAGGVMMATGVGGPVGLALVSAGADTIIQKATTGEVSWGQVALSGGLGLVGGGAAGWAARASTNGVAALRTTMAVNASVGGVTAEGSYLVKSHGQLSWRGAAGAFVGGSVAGGIGGAAGPAGGTIARQLGQNSTGFAASATTFGINASGGFVGNYAQTRVAGQDFDLGSAATSAGFAGAGGLFGDRLVSTKYPATGTTTLDSLSYFGPRTPGAFTPPLGPNTRNLVGGAGVGGAYGFGTDILFP